MIYKGILIFYQADSVINPQNTQQSIIRNRIESLRQITVPNSHFYKKSMKKKNPFSCGQKFALYDGVILSNLVF